MAYGKKLRSPKFGAELLLIAIIIIAFILIYVHYGTTGFVISICCWYLYLILYVFIFLLRTKNPVYWVSIFSLVFGGLLVWTFSDRITFIRPYVAVGTVFFAFWAVYLLLTRKMKWREREILELAAKSIHDTRDGFTGRPRPTGKVDSNKEEILKFSKFIFRYLIAVPYIEKDRVVIVVTGKIYKHLLNLKHGYIKDSWVALDFNGNVSVNISHRTYLRYQDELTFDQLCQSLGDLFKQFLELYKKGEGLRIIDRMDALKEQVWAEA